MISELSEPHLKPNFLISGNLSFLVISGHLLWRFMVVWYVLVYSHEKNPETRIITQLSIMTIDLLCFSELDEAPIAIFCVLFIYKVWFPSDFFCSLRYGFGNFWCPTPPPSKPASSSSSFLSCLFYFHLWNISGPLTIKFCKL